MLLAFVSQEGKLAVCLCCSKFRYLGDVRRVQRFKIGFGVS